MWLMPNRGVCCSIGSFFHVLGIGMVLVSSKIEGSQLRHYKKQNVWQ